MSKVANETIDLDGMTVQILRSPRRKTLSLEVGYEGIKARAPARMREVVIKQFIARKRSWIENTLAKLPPLHAPLNLQNGCELSVLGQTYPLLITKGQNAIHIDANQRLVVPVSSRTNSPELALRNKLTKWYKQVAMRHLELRVRNQAGKMLENSLTPKIKVRDYKRRWGSCDHRGDLSFNWRIIMAPERVMDYVVVHELAHLQEFNHSRRFWNIVEQEMSDWRDQQRWLSDNGSLLYRF
ncbi:MAG: putative metal-dependent hydrolase [Polaribacter sp.]|jgi:predicted metal-dependent hydrolase